MNAVRSQTFTLRPYRPADFQRLCEIDRLCFPEKIAYKPGEMREMLNADGAIAVVAETGSGDIAAFGIALAGAEGAGQVITLDVIPEFRHQGLGSRLMAAMEQKLAGLGVAGVKLETAEANRAAQKLFQKLGYRPVRKVSNYYPDGTDALVMGKSLAS